MSLSLPLPLLIAALTSAAAAAPAPVPALPNAYNVVWNQPAHHCEAAAPFNLTDYSVLTNKGDAWWVMGGRMGARMGAHMRNTPGGVRAGGQEAVEKKESTVPSLRCLAPAL